MPAMEMLHKDDPAKAIFDKAGDLSKFVLFGSQVLIGIYERPKITKSGIHLADQTVQEDHFQGKSGVVLLKGPAAFVDGADADFYGLSVEPGDWVSIFVSDGRQIQIRGQRCRIVDDCNVRMKIPSPDLIW